MKGWGTLNEIKVKLAAGKTVSESDQLWIADREESEVARELKIDREDPHGCVRIDPCRHLLFMAHDDGLEYRSPLFGRLKGIEGVENEDLNLGRKNCNSYSDGLEIQDALKLDLSLPAPSFFGGYYGYVLNPRCEGRLALREPSLRAKLTIYSDRSFQQLRRGVVHFSSTSGTVENIAEMGVVSSSGRVSYRHLLRTSYRENGVVKHKTLANPGPLTLR